MGVLSSFERRLSGLVEGTFAKVFKGWTEPVQIAGALTRELDNGKIRSARQTLVPNSFVVDLADRDHERLVPYSQDLCRELADMVREHAEEQRYSFAGPVTVHLAHDGRLTTGVFRIHSEVNGDGTVQEAASASPLRPQLPPPPLPHVAPAPSVAPPLPPVPVPPPTPAWVAEAAPAPAAPRPAAAGPGARLTVTYAGGDLEAAGRSFPLTAAVTRVGRAHDVDLRIDDTAVSRHHAEIRRLPDSRGFLLVDLGSTNGTSVNGRRVQTWELREGDRVQVGSATLAYHPDPVPAGTA